MKLTLQKLPLRFDEALYEMLQELPLQENGFTNSAHGLDRGTFPLWLESRREKERQEGLLDGWRVPETTWCLYAGDRPAGLGVVRHFLTDALRESGGNIGYAVRPSERGRGYGTALLGLLLGECAALGLDRALVTIREDNIPSQKAALRNGGTVTERREGRVYIWFDL